ncbi:MAG: GMC family oxidoreductase [Bacillota bacterium]|nr:GMC family oxidoreductase [Bacillota bacterium]
MNEQKFDYIVVGGGTAGATVAKILSDNRKNSVLLLEAGEDNDNDQPITNSTFAPVLQNLFFPQYFWQGEGVPQEELNNRTFRWTTGRLLGGASSVNRQLWVRPTDAVISKWEELLGPLWAPQAVIERFKALEKYNGQTDNPEARGFNGRVDVRQAPVEPTVMAQKLALAIEQATGFEQILDYNNPDTPIGPFTRNQYTQHPDGTRESSSTAFLTPDVVDNEGFGVNGRKLRVLTKTTALRIIFCGETARGVSYLKNGKPCEVFANKKVIVSAGIKSPSLLMRSGIGPADELINAGIDVVKDNPNVGQHMANHSIIPVVFSTNPNDPATPPNDPNAHLIAGAFLPDPATGSNPTLRAVQLEPFFSNNTLIVGVSPIQPKSRGTVEIQSSDPLKIELGDEEFLDNPDDLRLLMDTFTIYIKNIATALSNIDPQYQLLSPTMDIINNPVRLEAFIRQNLGLAFHEESTLRMARSEADGVTNFRGEVFGVENLVVADNSIIPFTADGNTSAPAYLIGFTIAHQLLREDECEKECKCGVEILKLRFSTPTRGSMNQPS